MIYFRNKKYGSTINCQFFAKDGANSYSLENYMVGDKVSIIFDVTTEQAGSINDMTGIEAYSDGFLEKPNWAVHIPFVVAERKHALSFRQNDPISLYALGTSITLEAMSGLWEDVFMWIVAGEKPEWAREEQDSA